MGSAAAEDPAWRGSLERFELPVANVSAALPVLLFFNLNITTFYFVAGLVLYEKGEGTLEALVVTPLRTSEYLASKIATLALLAILESLAIVLLVHGAGFDWPALLLGMFLLSAMYTLFGFLSVARYDSINEYLLPSTLYVAAIQLPVLDAVGLVPSPLWWLWPTRAPLVLLEAAFRPVGWGEIAYALVWSAAWLWILHRLARGAFQRFIVRREGVR